MKSEGAVLLAAGQGAISGDKIPEMVKADIAFHDYIYAASDNPLIAPTASMHWRQMRRVMGQVLRHAEPPATIWRQHAEILAAIVAGDPVRAESAATSHVRAAASRLQLALEAMAHPPDNQAATPDVNVRTRRTARSMGG